MSAPESQPGPDRPQDASAANPSAEASPSVPPFHVMAKPVCGLCNLDCEYCYYTAKPEELYPGTERFLMSDEVLDSYTRQFIEALPERVEFGWQGGEPTLAGIDFFRRAFELQDSYRKPGQQITNAFQTNGTLLDDQWCDMLAEREALVGISLDGPPQWHDAFRRDAAGNASFHRAWAGLERLRKRGVEHNVLVTLNAANAPHAGDIYRYFTNRGVQYLQFIPILERKPDGTPAEFSCSAEQFGRFMLDVFEVWAGRDVGKVSERYIDAVLHQIIFGASSMCCYAERCANAHVLEFNGDLYVCDHFVFKNWKIGNILETPLVELVRDAKLEEFAELKTALPRVCRDCEFLEFCRGGCPKHHMPIGTDPDRVNWFCKGYKMFLREALPELRRMAEYIKRGQTPPLAGPDPSKKRSAPIPAPGAPGPVPPEMARPVPRTQRKPKRNDPCPCGSGKKFKACCGR